MDPSPSPSSSPVPSPVPSVVVSPQSVSFYPSDALVTFGAYTFFTLGFHIVCIFLCVFFWNLKR